MTKIQNPTTFILLIRQNTAFDLSIRIYEHSKQTNALFNPLRRSWQRKKKHMQEASTRMPMARLGRIRLRRPIVHCGRRPLRAKRGTEKKPRRLRKGMTRGIALAGKVRNWSQKASFQTQSWALPEEEEEEIWKNGYVPEMGEGGRSFVVAMVGSVIRRRRDSKGRSRKWMYFQDFVKWKCLGSKLENCHIWAMLEVSLFFYYPKCFFFLRNYIIAHMYLVERVLINLI